MGWMSCWVLCLLLCCLGAAKVLVFDAYQDVSVSREDEQRRSLREQRQPLFRGQGTHYVFLWVGTPPQRVSVIVDTGSHHTAFPCVGCKCGKHMDPYFDPEKSSSSSVKKCGFGKCHFRQSYSEGSSWQAYKVTDFVRTGTAERVEGNQSISFEFGCQSSETGLFRTQNVDGIMGLSASDETFPFQLHGQKQADSRLFTLCFRVGGGVVSFGGFDPSLQSLATSPLQYARLTKTRGWFTVRVIDIFFFDNSSKNSISVKNNSKSGKRRNAAVAVKNDNSQALKSIGGPLFKCNAGKGTIVDSGTTDTYLPSAMHEAFTSLFRALTGRVYKNEAMKLTATELEAFPSIVFRLAGLVEGEVVDVEVAPSSYMERGAKENTYTPRVYLTESVGAVLGANFMNNHLIVFDVDQQRIGFAKSACEGVRR